MVKTATPYPKFGEIVIRKKLAPPSAIDEALAIQQLEYEEGGTRPKLGELLIRQNILSSKTVREILDEQKLRTGSRRVLRIKTTIKHGIAVISLEGRLDQIKGEALRKTLSHYMDEGTVKFAVNADRLVYINIAGLSAILNIVDHARSLGGDIKFFSVTYTGVIFRKIGLDKFIQLLDSEFDAIDAFKQPIDSVMSKGTVGEFVSTQNGKYFHLSYCKSTHTIPLGEKIFYPSRGVAVGDGKRPCPSCKP